MRVSANANKYEDRTDTQEKSSAQGRTAEDGELCAAHMGTGTPKSVDSAMPMDARTPRPGSNAPAAMRTAIILTAPPSSSASSICIAGGPDVLTSLTTANADRGPKVRQSGEKMGRIPRRRGQNPIEPPPSFSVERSPEHGSAEQPDRARQSDTDVPTPDSLLQEPRFAFQQTQQTLHLHTNKDRLHPPSTSSTLTSPAITQAVPQPSRASTLRPAPPATQTCASRRPRDTPHIHEETPEPQLERGSPP